MQTSGLRPDVYAKTPGFSRGQGFYLTNIYKQAKSWAETIAERKGRNVQPIISSYDFDLDLVIDDGYRVKIFETYDL